MIITIIESCARAKPEVTDEILVYNLRKKTKTKTKTRDSYRYKITG